MTDLSPDQIARLRDFVDRWRKTGPILDEIRLQALESLSEDDARRMSNDLFELWRPSDDDPRGEELVLQQRVFAKWRRFPTNAELDDRTP